MKHITHINNFGSIPRIKVLIKVIGSYKHVTKILYVTRFIAPSTYRLVKFPSVMEHIFHILYSGYIPCANVLVKFIGSEKHELHVNHVRSIPRSYISIKAFCTSEHIVHKSNFRSIPRIKVLIK